MSSLLWDEVDDGEDGDPDDIHEVPVESSNLHLRIVPAVESATKGEHHQDGEPEDPAGDVGAMESGENEERRSEQTGGELEALVEGERCELVHLIEHEMQAEEGRGAEPERRRLDAVLLKARKSE